MRIYIIPRRCQVFILPAWITLHGPQSCCCCPAFLNKSVDYQWEMGVHHILAVPAPEGLGVDGQRMLNLQWEMGDGKRETTDPAARSLDAVQDSSGWSVKDGRSQRDMGNWQTGRGLMAHESWPMSTGTVLKLSPRGPFAR